MTMKICTIRLPLSCLLCLISFAGSSQAQSSDMGLFGEAYHSEELERAAPTQSRIRWLDIGPSEDTHLIQTSGIGRIEFTPDGKHIFFKSQFITMDGGYLWHIEESNFSEYAPMDQRTINQNRDRPFAKPPHPLRRDVVPFPGRIPGSNLNAVLNNGFSLSAPGKYSTMRYFTTDWNVQQGAGSASLTIGMQESSSSNFILQNFPGPNYSRNGLLHYGIVNLTRLTSQALPVEYQTRPTRYCLGQDGLSVACFLDRGIEIHTLEGKTQTRKVQFAYPVERPRIDSTSFMNGDKWLVCIFRQPGQPGVRIWVIDVQTGDLVQTIEAPDYAPVDAKFSTSGTRLIRRCPTGVAFYQIQKGELQLIDAPVSDSDLAVVSASKVYQLSHDGTAIAFVQNSSGRNPGTVGLLEWP